MAGSMTERCPRCRSEIENPRSLVCPACGYSLRLPLVGKVGTVLVIGGLFSLLSALFIAERWLDILTGGLGAMAVGMAALFAAAWMLGKARRA
jgi:hypothetical protein